MKFITIVIIFQRYNPHLRNQYCTEEGSTVTISYQCREITQMAASKFMISIEEQAIMTGVLYRDCQIAYKTKNPRYPTTY